MPVGCARAYSDIWGDSAVPPTSSALYSSSAFGDCMAKAGRDREEMKPANGCASVIFTSCSPVASHSL